jgi:hypothetical protein
MPFDFTTRFVMPLTLGTVSLAFIALGLYALIRRRPFVIDARWLLALVVLALSPSVFMQLLIFLGENQHRSRGLILVSLIWVVTMIILAGFIALQLRGYMTFGTTQDSFREALVSALSNLNLESEETLSSIRLPSVPAELQVAVHGWIGTGQLRLRSGGRPGLLPDIAGGMNAYFNSAEVKTNMTLAAFYLILGVLISAMVVTLIVAMAPSASIPDGMTSWVSLRVQLSSDTSHVRSSNQASVSAP